jgi:putative addiction module component (TIGR02574 family)
LQQKKTTIDINPFNDIWNRQNIMESVNQLAKKAIGLQPIERIRLVEAILYSLDKPDPDIEQSWIAESEARYDAYKRGELEAIDWDEIKKGLNFEGSLYCPRQY